ncbi:helix-turn-helix transcriptional regulator [Streptomyces sp. NPDC051662]|uniref:helix-turn-helix domain-containing protein n=1 Tax=Streptomyces sp. NPDC051662 TaxID=3154750 RepID=UPI00342F1087
MSMSTEETLRLTIEALRMRCGERQSDLAAGIGQAQTQVSRKQSGRAHWSLDDVDLLAAHYQLPVLDLLAGPTHAAERLSAGRRQAGGPQTLIPVLAVTTAQAAPVPPPPPAAAVPAPGAAIRTSEPAPAPAPVPLAPDRSPDGRLVQEEQQPCVLCGEPATARAGGRPQHPMGWCVAPPGPEPAPAPSGDDLAAGGASPQTAPPPRTPRRAPGPAAGSLAEMISDRVSTALRESGGDIDAAGQALIKKAIPDVMELFRISRVGGRYEHSDFPPTEEILKKKSQKGPDMIWEGRPKWRNAPLAKAARAGETELTVFRLDMNAAYLAAMKTHLPIGKLVQDTTGEHNRKRAGVHLITPGEWEHEDLPNPLGARKEPGNLWVTEATLRLLLRCAHLDLCATPLIRESWTSGSTEGLLEKLRRALADVRKEAIENGNELAELYVKSMYSKFVSTIGESSSNRDMRRPDWMHIIRSQAFANLWLKADKARAAGLTVVEMSGTDELHVAGDWRAVFPEGRNLNQVKEKNVYTLGGK